MANKKEMDMVQIELFKDNDKYKDDVTVGLNGKIYRIQRGRPVSVPRAVAEIVEHSLDQDKKTALMITGYENEFRSKRDNLTE